MSRKVRISVPGIDVKTMNDVVRGIYSKHPTPVKYVEIASMLSIKPTHVSSACVTANELGLLERTERGVYRLSADGLKYGQFLEAKKRQENAKLLQNKILTSPYWEDILAFLKANVGRKRKIEDLALYVAQRLNKSWKAQTQTVYGRFYAGILELANLVEYTRNSGEILPTIRGEAAAEAEEVTAVAIPISTTIEKVPASLQFSINVDLKDENSVNALLKLLSALGYEVKETD
jgi:hypothetical protein